MKKTGIIILMSLVAVAFKTLAQEDSTYRTAPLQIGFVPPLSTNGMANINTVNGVSLNLFMGAAYGVDGFEAGGFLNMNRGFVKGFQAAGFANIVGGPVEGAQLSGFLNAVNGDITGVQAAGFLNTSGKATEVVQLAGFANVSSDINGVQASGFGNYAGRLEGLQAAGFMNTAQDVNGIQAAGFINVAKDVKGIQLAGFINICDSIDGIPIAFLSVVRKNGYRSLEISSNELYYLNGAFKMGVPAFYTVFGFGFNPGYTRYNFATTIGFGSNMYFTPKNSVNVEALMMNPIKRSQWFYEDHSRLYSLRLSFAHELAPHLSIFAGPALTFIVADPEEQYAELLPSWNSRVFENRHSDIAFWPGFQAGIRF